MFRVKKDKVDRGCLRVSAIMKKILIVLFFGFQQVFACSCATIPLMDRIPRSDFIATAKIIKVEPDEENSDLHDIQIEIIDLYKGKAITHLKINSSLHSSCPFFTPEDSEWLIFASENEHGELSFGFCSGAKRLDRKFNSEIYPYAETNYNKSIALKLQVLKFLKTEGIMSINEYKLRSSFSNSCLREFKGIEIKGERFALYELMVEDDLSISNVKALKEFDNMEIKSNLLQCIVESVKVHRRNKETNILKRTKIIIGLYYYPAQRGNESFIGQFDL